MRAWAITICVLVLSCDSGKKAPVQNKRDAAVTTTADCDLLLGHLVDLELASVTANATTDGMRQELAKQRTAIIDAKREEFRASCLPMPRDRIMCALAAKDSAAIDACDAAPTH